jgi:hypothetical protein
MADDLKEKMAKFLGIQDRLGAVLFWASCLTCLVNLGLTVNFLLPRWRQLRFLRLHYTAALGIDWVADWRYIFIFPGLAIAVVFINGWLAGRLAGKHRRLGLMALAATVAVQVFFAFGAVIAVSLNG